MLSKRCTRCGRRLSLAQFYPQARGRGGRSTRCKQCVCEVARLNRATMTPAERKALSTPGRSKAWWASLSPSRRAAHLAAAKRSRAKWVADHPAYHREYNARRYREDPVFNLTVKIRRRIHMALRYAKDGRRDRRRSIADLGCSYNDLKVYIESLFSRGMTWRDVFTGRIHLDHIKPCADFDLTDPEQRRACFHYTNLQPLWKADNLRKGAHYPFTGD